ncbi:MAG: carboxypeptidase regulatory-like domain-containing protein [Acidobacteriota bacterium]|nr:carboxypeptidase regulatory-like domain-containing protein [Acidobacteriota bacterium]
MTQRAKWTAAALAAALLVSATGCKTSPAIRQGAVLGNGTKPVTAPLDPATLGTLTGTVHFNGKPPARVKIDMSQDPACSMMAGTNLTEQYVVNDGGLANVYVSIKSGPAVAMTAPSTSNAPTVMDQTGCRYAPHVVALMRGNSVEFRNSDPTMHNIHTMPVLAGEAPTDLAQAPRGPAQWVQYKEPVTMEPVRCNNHPWMEAFINVSDTPFFAVTDGSGHFTIDGLPAGHYVLAVAHEKLGEQTMEITVKPHQTTQADFSYTAK